MKTWEKKLNAQVVRAEPDKIFFYAITTYIKTQNIINTPESSLMLHSHQYHLYPEVTTIPTSVNIDISFSRSIEILL